MCEDVRCRVLHYTDRRRCFEPNDWMRNDLVRILWIANDQTEIFALIVKRLRVVGSHIEWNWSSRFVDDHTNDAVGLVVWP